MTSSYPYRTCMSHLINLPSLQQWQDFHTFYMESNIIFHRNITEYTTANTKTTGNISVNTTVLILMHYELFRLCTEHACPYEGQSSHSTLNVTETSYIWVTKNPHLCMETAFPYKGQTSHPSFLLVSTSSYFWVSP